nr:MAG TPA: hypothetical protein [Crassvirales sp.]
MLNNRSRWVFLCVIFCNISARLCRPSLTGTL